MNSLLLATIAIVCNVAAQLAIKLTGRYLIVTTGFFSYVSPMLILAVGLYGLSFIITVRVYAVNELSVAAPFMAGGAFLLVAVTSSVLLSENMGVSKITGMILIITGLYLLTRK